MMKNVVAAASLTSFASALAEPTLDAKNAFQSFVAKHNKQYTEDELPQRLETFKANYAIIQAQNAKRLAHKEKKMIYMASKRSSLEDEDEMKRNDLFRKDDLVPDEEDEEKVIS